MATPIQVLSNHTIVNTDVRAALKTLQLPDISQYPGKLVYIKDVYGNSATNYIHVSTTGANQFERSLNTQLRLSTNYGSWTFTNDGTNKWMYLDVYENTVPKFPVASNLLFTPAAIPNLTLWFDAADSTYTSVTAGKVTKWQSKVGSFAVSQATAGRQPVYTTNAQNGLPVLTFTAGSLTSLTAFNMPLVGSKSLTIVAACQYTTASVGYIFSMNNGGSTSNGQIIFGKDGASIIAGGLFVTSSSEKVRLNSEPSGTSWRIFTFKCDRESAQSSIFINSSNSVTSNIGYNITNNIDSNSQQYSITIGAYNTGNVPGINYFTGNLGELLVYNSALSDEDRYKVEGYLATKWNLTGTLSALNPYKIATVSLMPIPFTLPNLFASFDARTYVTGSTTWYDQSSNNRHATLVVGNPQKSQNGNTMLFDGGTIWSFPYSDLNFRYSMMVWFRNTGTNYGNGTASILLTPYSPYFTNQVYSISYKSDIGLTGGYYTYDTGFQGTPGLSKFDNDFIHLAFTADSSSLKMYINGEFMGSRPITVGSPQNDQSNCIGGSAINFGGLNLSEFFIGEIGSVKIYDSNIPADTIAKIYRGEASIYSS
jgi:hypothetical protein